MRRRLKLVLAIGLLVFVLGLCGGVPNTQSTQKISYYVQTIVLPDMYLFQHLFLSGH